MAGLSSEIGLIVLIELIAALVGIASVFLAWENARGIVLTAMGVYRLGDSWDHYPRTL